jgi:hypothetical protein
MRHMVSEFWKRSGLRTSLSVSACSLMGTGFPRPRGRLECP